MGNQISRFKHGNMEAFEGLSLDITAAPNSYAGDDFEHFFVFLKDRSPERIYAAPCFVLTSWNHHFCFENRLNQMPCKWQ